MVTILVILLVVLFGVALILFASLIVTIDSVKEIFAVRLSYLAYADVKLVENQLFIDTSVLGFKNRRLLTDGRRKPKPIKTGEKGNRPEKPFLSRGTLRRVKRFLQSFRVEKFQLNMDTGDYCHNAVLYPICFLKNTQKYQLNINYQGVNELRVVLRNRPIRILLALLL